MPKAKVLIILALMILCMTFTWIDCGKDKPTQSPAPQGTLLLSRVSVAMVPGASERVAIFAQNASGARDTCSITVDNSDVASATLADSTITITGITVGTSNITVTSRCGATRPVIVQVYDPTIIDTGELLITYTASFTLAATQYIFSFWEPVPPEGFYSLGQLAEAGYSDPSGISAVMVVKAKAGSNAIAFTHDVNSPPSGYKVMGDRFTYPQDSIICIREDLTIPGSAVQHIFNVGYLSAWKIEQPDAGPHSGAYLAPGTCVIVWGSNPPNASPMANVLNVNLPLLAEAPVQSFAPKLEGYLSPPTETQPLFAKAMLVPCTIVNDLAHQDDIPWRVANSPFYRLERMVYYKLLYHNYNNTSEVQTNSVLIRSGVTTSESQSFHMNTGVSITTEAGVDFEVVSAKITATVSVEFGYETQTSVTQLQEKEVTSTINTHPGKAAALWQEYNRYILYRHNGTDLEPVTAWEFGIDSYMTDEYPDD